MRHSGKADDFEGEPNKSRLLDTHEADSPILSKGGGASAPTDRESILRQQLAFLKQMDAGCLFAALAARDPPMYGWTHQFPDQRKAEIDGCITSAIENVDVAMLSLVFPEITGAKDLLRFIGILKRCELLTLEQCEPAYGDMCLGFRAKVGNLRSYVTGFGNFAFLPKTRRTPFTEIVMRVKPRPAYDYVFKEAPPGVIHLADLDMRGMERQKMRGLWDGSFAQTRKILGAEPDLRSAARTTYSIPMDLMSECP